MTTVMRNERGIALVITLLVVTLLAITVVEFTFSAQVDQHMARNALNGLQASLLARSGVNLGEAFLLHDDDAEVDAYAEDWGQIDLLDSEVIVPENMHLRVRIIDESGKLNINLTRPQNVNQWRATIANPDAERPQLFQSWQAALARLMEGRSIDPVVAEEVSAYWDRVFEAYFGTPIGAGAEGTAPATPTPRTARQMRDLLVGMDFPSLDDGSLIPGLSPDVVRRLRPVVTALGSNQQRQVNANTAPPEVLSAIVGDAGAVDEIVAQRQEEGLTRSDLSALLAGIDQQDPHARNARAMLGVRSSYFLIRASAVINPDPVSGQGGIRRSASMLVRRSRRAGARRGGAADAPRWTLTRLDWHKEGGAALFAEQEDDDDAEFGSTARRLDG